MVTITHDTPADGSFSAEGAAHWEAPHIVEGLGTLATQDGTFSGISSGNNTGDQSSVTGNAGTATALATARAINGVNFDGTAPITITAAAGTLSGATLAAGVTASSLLSAAGGPFGTAAFTAASAYDAAGVAAALLLSANAWTGVNTFGTIGGAVGKLVLAGSTSGSTILNAAAVAGTTTITLPGTTTTLAGLAVAQTFTGINTLTPAVNAKSLIVTGVTHTADSPIFDLAQTWNNSGITFNALKLNVTNTASAAASLLFDLQVAAASKFYVDVSGNTVQAGNSTIPNAKNIFLSTGGVTGNYIGSAATAIFANNSVVQGGWNTGGFYFRKLFLDYANADVVLTRSAAATLQQGDANAASPVAQTLQAQGSRSGTDSNVGGANYTWQPGLGTGTGTAASAIISAPTVAASGTGAQTMSEIMRFNTTTGATVKAGVALRLGNAATTGLAAGVLAATTNATLVIVDSAGQAYRIPCII